MCKSISKVLRQIPNKIAEITDLDLMAAKAAMNWIRLHLVPNMSQDELRTFKALMLESSKDIENRILIKGGLNNG